MLKNAISNHTPNRLFRFALTKTLEMELPGCNLPGCESHTETEWPILNEVFEFMKSSLKEAVFLLSNCQGGYNNLFWIERFAMEKSKGVNVCTLWAPNQKDDFKLISYYWGESNTAASLIDLIKRTLAGERQAISIWSKGGSDQRAFPDNLFEVFLILTELRRDAIKIVLKNLVDLLQRSYGCVCHRDRLGMIARNLR